MKVKVDNTEGFTCRAAGEGSLDGRTFVYDGRVTVNSKRSSGGAINVASGYPGVDQGDDPTSRGVSGGEVNSMRSEDLLKSSQVIVRGGTDILYTDNIIPIQKSLEMGDDFEVTRDQTTRETEATRVDVSGNNGRDLEVGNRVTGKGIGGGVLGVNVLTGIDLHGRRD
jgi:hypothetical protein